MVRSAYYVAEQQITHEASEGSKAGVSHLWKMTLSSSLILDLQNVFQY